MKSNRLENPKINPTWRELLSESICTPEMISQHFAVDAFEIKEVTMRYPMRINPYYGSLIRHEDDAIYRQCVPDIREIRNKKGLEDPLNEEELSPVPGVTHKYPDRVLFLVSYECAMYCRFCNRKRKVGRADMVTRNSVREGIRYIRDNKHIRDVLLSGGDPLLLEDEEIRSILSDLRAIPHVEIIRIGTRVPCTLPQRITPELSDLLKKFHPIYIVTHFNHPWEITPQAATACMGLADAGIPMGCQTVLLKGVNDDISIMKELMQKLLKIRVRPYYLFQADLAKGTSHFWTPVKTGLDIMAGLQGYTSGLCLPHYAVDLPGGGGKVPLLPRYIVGEDAGEMRLKNYRGKEYRFPTEYAGGDSRKDPAEVERRPYD